MSLRLRLLLVIGIALSVLWGGTALWMQHDLDHKLRGALDHRLKMAAEMTAGMLEQHPALAHGGAPGAARPLSIAAPLEENGMICEISPVRGQVVGAALTPVLAGLAPGGPGFADRVIDGHAWRTYTIASRGLMITMADRISERQSMMRTLMLTASAPFAVALAGGLLVLWLGVGQALLPLERLRQALAARAPDALDAVRDEPTPRDLRPFLATLNDLLARIRGTVARERRFTSDAAHELRTPLTAIKLHLQVLRMELGENPPAALAHVEEGVARMQHTMEQLLMLARVEGPASWNDGPAVRADDVAYLAMRDAAPLAPHQIALSVVEAGDGQALLALPLALAVTALRNLLDNALRHAPSAQPVQLALSTTPEQACFRVSDAGPGLTPEELAQATERFWRRGSSGSGSGLGLAIVEAIVTRFGGRMILARAVQGGLEVTLLLPRARPRQEAEEEAEPETEAETGPKTAPTLTLR